jgi:hypothetical protein
MAESSWEAHTRRQPWLWKWPLLILIVIVAVGIIIYNNRDVISGTAVAQEKPDSLTSVSFSVVSDDRAAAGHVAAAVNEQPQRRVESASAARPKVRKGSVVPVDRQMTASVPSVLRKGPELPEKPKPVIPSKTEVDSVEIGEVPCAMLNRRDITVRIVLVVYCDKAKRAEVVLRRDALAVVTRDLIRKRDIEEIRFDALEPELLRSMNLVFDTHTITGIAFRSVRIEKASYE